MSTQLIPFDTNKGGKVPNFCLDNVRRGYGIANKYGSAWEAWLHTEQHPDRNIPTGLDVPLYYSYTATLPETLPDGTVKQVTKNYGHINVRLRDGTVWSDGNIYANLDSYLVNHFPKFVGWGESVNDFKIIGADMAKTPISPDLVHQHYINYTGVDPGADSPALQNRFEDPVDDEFWFGLVPMMNNIRVSQAKQIEEEAKTITTLQGQVADLTSKLAVAQSSPPVTPQTDPSVTVTQSGLWAAFKKFLGL